jgi:hypothetical protein
MSEHQVCIQEEINDYVEKETKKADKNIISVQKMLTFFLV